TDDLRRRVKAHRLGIEQPAAEGIGVIVLQPGRDIDELSEARGMALRKTVGTEPLDLLKAILGKLRFVAAPDHIPDQLLFKISDRSNVAKCCHRTAQPVRLL